MYLDKSNRFKWIEDVEELELLFFEPLNISKASLGWSIEQKLFLESVFDKHHERRYGQIVLLKEGYVIAVVEGRWEKGTSFIMINDSNLTFKEGDKIALQENRVVKFEDEALEIVPVEKGDFYWRKNLFDSYNYNTPDAVITKEDVDKAVEEMARKKAQEEAQHKQEQEERARKEDEEQQRIGDYDCGLEVEFNKVNIKDNIITESQERIILDVPVNKIFPANFWTGYGGKFSKAYLELREKRINHEFQKEFNGKWERKFKVEYKEEGYFLNGVRIARNKVNFIIDRLKRDTTPEQIALYNKMSGMKLDMLNLQNINICVSGIGRKDYPVPIEVTIVDKDNFEIDIMGSKRKWNWDECKKWFFRGGSSRNIYSSMEVKLFLKFIQEFGKSKEEIYSKLRKIEMLRKLEKNAN